MDIEPIIFSLSSDTSLLDSIMKEFADNNVTDIRVGKVHKDKFSDGELCPDFLTSVRGKRIYILSSPNTSAKIIQLNLAIDAAKRAAAGEIIPIIPYFPYARQDKKDQTRGPIAAKVMAEMLENRGSTQVITLDLHADQIQGFFNIPVTHMEGKYIFDRYVHDLYVQYGDNLILCAPDAGASKRVKGFRDTIRERWDIDLGMVMIDKTREKANVVGKVVLIGDVKDKHIVIIDDMCDTAGTLCKAAEELLKLGALSVRAVVTHGIFSGPAYERFSTDALTEIVCSDSLPIASEIKVTVMMGAEDEHDQWAIDGFEKVKYITTARQIYLAMTAINGNTSVEDLKNAK
jgi:ribose-phosphate pyrophosphokinase